MHVPLGLAVGRPRVSASAIVLGRGERPRVWNGTSPALRNWLGLDWSLEVVKIITCLEVGFLLDVSNAFVGEHAKMILG